MAKGGKVQHWKHGWIPLDDYARAIVAAKKGRPKLAVSTSASAPYDRAEELTNHAVWLREAAKVGLPKDRGGRDRLFSPEAEGEAARLLSRFQEVEPTITPQLVRTAAANGGHMMGLDNRLKTQAKLAEKLERKAKTRNMTVQEYGARVADALRYTMIAPEGSYGEVTQKTIDSFRSQGYRVDVENTWTPGAAYKGVNTNLSKDGLTFELQFHTDASFAAKKAQHADYVIARSVDTPPKKRAEIMAAMEANMAAMPTPPGASAVH